MRVLTPAAVEDVLVGCAILGTGGGGSLQQGLKFVSEISKKGKEFKLATMDEFDEEDLIGSPYYCGAVTPEGKKKTENGVVALHAVHTLEKYLNEEFKGVIAAELGGFSTAGAMGVAAERGLPLLDADAAGRAAPDLQCSIFYVNKVPITPIGVATPLGDLLTIHYVPDDERAEKIIREIAVLSEGMVGVCDHPARVNVLKKAAIPGTISQAERLGAARREALEKGEDPVTAVVNARQGLLRFRGIVEKHSWQLESGFTVGEITMRGIEEDAGSSYCIRYKNENIISWKDDQVDVTVPDLIVVLDPDTGMPITNPNCDQEKRVTVLAFPAPQAWRIPAGLAVMGPKFFGYDVEYTPIEQRIKREF